MLLCLINGIRYNIVFICQYFAEYVAYLCTLHWQEIKQVFYYLEGIKDLVLKYRGKETSLQLEGYSDVYEVGYIEMYY